MFSNQGGRKSVDSLSPTTIPAGHRADFPFHGYARASRLPLSLGPVDQEPQPRQIANNSKNSIPWPASPPPAERLDGELYPLGRGLARHLGELVTRSL